MRTIALAAAVLLSLVLHPVPAQAQYALPLEGYAKYAPQKKCVRKDRVGTVQLARWLSMRGGTYGGTLRSCGSGGQSEHKDGRAFDWMLDADSEDDAMTAEAFIVEAFADDEIGGTHALARRMGIMYVIWDDKIYSAWYNFEPRPYKAGSSKTSRHRDHIHISLSKRGANAKTSWFVENAASLAALPAPARRSRIKPVD